MKKVVSFLLVTLLVFLSAAVTPVCAAQSKAEQYLASMSTKDKISMMLMPAFRWKTDEEGNKTNVTEITDDIAETLKKHSFAGVILFAQNTATNEGATRLVDALQKANAAGGDRPQLLISIDQEGGDGEATILDATCIQRYIADMNAPDGIGKPCAELI